MKQIHDVIDEVAATFAEDEQCLSGLCNHLLLSQIVSLAHVFHVGGRDTNFAVDLLAEALRYQHEPYCAVIEENPEGHSPTLTLYASPEDAEDDNAAGDPFVFPYHYPAALMAQHLWMTPASKTSDGRQVYISTSKTKEDAA